MKVEVESVERLTKHIADKKELLTKRPWPSSRIFHLYSALLTTNLRDLKDR